MSCRLAFVASVNRLHFCILFTVQGLTGGSCSGHSYVSHSSLCSNRCHTRHPFVCPLLPAPGAFADCLVRIPFNLAFAFAARQLRFLSFSFFYFPSFYLFFFWRLFHNFNKVHWDFPGVQCAQSIVISSAISKYPTAIGDDDHRCSVCVDFHIFSLHFLFINTNGWLVCPPSSPLSDSPGITLSLHDRPNLHGA